MNRIGSPKKYAGARIFTTTDLEWGRLEIGGRGELAKVFMGGGGGAGPNPDLELASGILTIVSDFVYFF